MRKQTMAPFRFILAVFILALTFVGQSAGAVHAPKKHGSDRENGFLPLCAPDRQAETKALLDEFAAKAYADFRHDGGVPDSGDLQQIFFENDAESRFVEKWPGMVLRYDNGTLFLKDANGERSLAEVGSLRDMAPDWPLAHVAVGDIDFDGHPDFFILTRPAASGSFGYRLLNWDRKNPQGLPLFAPFPESKLPPSPDEWEEWLYFDRGNVPSPNFIREKKVLEFIYRHGPYYDSERWCFSETQYYLCEKLRQSYYPYADNMYQIVRQMRFDRQGNVQSIICRPIGDFEEKAELLFAAETAIPVYANPGDLRSRAGALEQGEIVRVLDYKMSTFGPDTPALWYEIGPLRGKGGTGWCCVTLDEPVFSENALLIGESKNGRYKASGVRRGAAGIEVMLNNDSGPIVIRWLPLVMRPFSLPGTQEEFFKDAAPAIRRY